MGTSRRKSPSEFIHRRTGRTKTIWKAVRKGFEARISLHPEDPHRLILFVVRDGKPSVFEMILKRHEEEKADPSGDAM